MKEFPTLTTQRLILNLPKENDLEDIVLQLNITSEFSENTLNIPFPYKKEDAEFWIKEIVRRGFENETNYTFAIRNIESLKLIGGIGIHTDRKHQKAEVGYWLGKDFWNKGYVSESLKAIIKFGFLNLGLNKIYATHYPHNPASGKVMQKCGMRKEAEMKQEFFKNGKFLDIIRYSILKEDFQNFQQ